MYTIISKSQSEFIKARSIHDNFLCVQNYVRRLHRTNTPAIFLNLDIKKAFNLVTWDYLLDLMQRCVFPHGLKIVLWHCFITSSSRVLHGRGLRQEDPLSPLLFDIAIDPFQNLLEVATANGNLHRLHGRGPTICTSLYADDAAIFVAPFKEDFEVLPHILDGFSEVMGLVTKYTKASRHPLDAPTLIFKTSCKACLFKSPISLSNILACHKEH
jgi:hypothetical protein